MGLIDLSKKVEIVLTKRGALAVKARVGLAVDVSGSMEALYRLGTVQRVVERFLALAMRLDDDQRLDAWAFNDRIAALPPATAADIDGYVFQNIVSEGMVGGGTSYAPPITAALDHWHPKTGLLGRLFGKAKAASSLPSLLIFVTDGENQDEAEARAAMDRAAGLPVYFAFVGIGGGQFRFLEKVEAMPNVGFMSVPDIGGIDDDDLYDRLVTQELADWLKSAPRSAA